ncbi:MAG: nucleotide exchange factor GrpE [Sumerlaeia bacterium]
MTWMPYDYREMDRLEPRRQPAHAVAADAVREHLEPRRREPFELAGPRPPARKPNAKAAPPPPPREEPVDPPPAPREPVNTDRENLLRLAADLQNVRARAKRDLEAARTQERQRVLAGFLEVVDNFDRALAAEGAEDNRWLDGFRATRDQMLGKLREFGAEPIVAVGQAFDPRLHEAIGTASAPDGVAPGAILEDYQMGFVFQDGTLLRPARVLVAQ